MHALILTLSLMTTRGPLPIADSAWTQPADVREADRARALEQTHVEQQHVSAPPPVVQRKVDAPKPARTAEDRHFAITASASLFIAMPSLELEVLPVNYVSGYVQGQLGILAPGYAVQAGVRVRPMKGLIGPFLDLHVRHSHFEGLTWTLDEQVSPGVMGGFSLVSRGGFLFSAGVGVTFLAQTSSTHYGVKGVSAGPFVLPVITSKTERDFGAQPELRLNLGYAF